MDKPTLLLPLRSIRWGDGVKLLLFWGFFVALYIACAVAALTSLEGTPSPRATPASPPAPTR